MTVADNLNVDATELATLTADGHAIAADCARLGIAGNVPSSLDLVLSARRVLWRWLPMSSRSRSRRMEVGPLART